MDMFVYPYAGVQKQQARMLKLVIGLLGIEYSSVYH